MTLIGLPNIRFVSVMTALGTVVACGAPQTPSIPAKASAAPPASVSAPTPAASSAVAPRAQLPAAEALLDVDLVPNKVSPAPKTMPKISIDTPGVDQFLPASFVKEYKVRPNIRGWAGLPEGSYLQLLLDNRPYRPITNPKESIQLADLAPDGKLTEGEHVLAGFLCRGNHESYKGQDGAVVNRFWVGKKGAPQWNSTSPMLIMHRPTGTYKGPEADSIAIDWYVLNAVIGDKDYFLRVTLTGPGIREEGLRRNITDWTPYVIVSPHNGQYTLAAELLDKGGNPAPGAWNNTTRTFTVEK